MTEVGAVESDANIAAIAPRDLQTRRVTVGGRDLRVAVWAGDPSRTPLLIFNGIGARVELLAPLVKHLDPGREVIAFDVPGTGDSPAPRLPYRLWMLVRLTTKLLDTLGYNRVDAMGISWGGALAQQFAMQRARRCRRLILAATTPGVLSMPGNLRILAKMVSPRRYADPDYIALNFGSLYGGVARTSLDMFRQFADLVKPTSRVGYLYQQLALAGWTSMPFLPFIRQPTLVLAGEDDPLVPVANARLMAKLIPRATLTTFDDGHLFVLSKARQCARKIEEFLDYTE